jgi:hypothetical protein
MDSRCPRHLKELPKTTCSWGKRKAMSMQTSRQNIEDVTGNECVWYINDPKLQYCFFNYVYNHNNYGNAMTFREIATLFGTSINNIKLRETEAFKNFMDIWNAGFDV